MSGSSIVGRAAAVSFAVAALTFTLAACSLLVDTSDLSGGDAHDAGPDVVQLDGNMAADALTDATSEAAAVDAPSSGPIAFDPGSTWPVSTAATIRTPTTPVFTTSAGCTDLIVLANSGINGGSTAAASIASTTGLTFTEVVSDAGNNADTIYIWRATDSCASRSGAVSVTWKLPDATSIFWSNVVVMAFTHSKGIGATASAHNPGNTSLNTISITPSAAGSWVFASLSGNNGEDASSATVSGNFVQAWSKEGAIHSFGPSAVPSGTKLGVPITFSMKSPDSIWASAAVEVLSR